MSMRLCVGMSNRPAHSDGAGRPGLPICGLLLPGAWIPVSAWRSARRGWFSAASAVRLSNSSRSRTLTTCSAPIEVPVLEN